MPITDPIDELADKVRHHTCEVELWLFQLVKKLRGCPYAGKTGSTCKGSIRQDDKGEQTDKPRVDEDSG